MPRGTPDYGNPNYTFSSVVNDNMDLLSMNAGVARIDNRGRIIWYDDFRGGLSRWAISASGSGITPILTQESGFSFGHYGSVKLDPFILGGESTMEMQSVAPVSEKIGIEVSVYPVQGFASFSLNLYGWHTGSNGKYMAFYLESGTGDIKINHLSGLAMVADISSSALVMGRWNTIKLVGNYLTGKYERLLYGNTQYDISSYFMPNVSNAIGGHISIGITVESVANPNFEPVYIGHVIISGDEP